MSYSRSITTANAGTAAAMAACTVHTIMKKSPKKKESASSKPVKKTPKPTVKKTDKEPTFLDAVYKIVRRIPRGRVTSYGAIAEAAGIRLSARMVGWAMNAAGRVTPPVPAHRVVNSKGLLTGKMHFDTPTLMQELLEQEGVRVENDQVQQFPEVFWDPMPHKSKRKKP